MADILGAFRERHDCDKDMNEKKTVFGCAELMAARERGARQSPIQHFPPAKNNIQTFCNTHFNAVYSLHFPQEFFVTSAHWLLQVIPIPRCCGVRVEKPVSKKLSIRLPLLIRRQFDQAH